MKTRSYSLQARKLSLRLIGAYSYAQLFFNNNINLNILQAHLKFIYGNIQNSSF